MTRWDIHQGAFELGWRVIRALNAEEKRPVVIRDRCWLAGHR